MADLKGKCDPRFQRVYDAMAKNIDAGNEIGASFAVNIDGEDVIDLWGGWRDKERTIPWTEDTIVNVFSSSKTITSLALLVLVERGQLDLDAPVAKYWPEFAQNGKEKALVRHLMSHTVGLAGWDPPFTTEDAIDLPRSAAMLAAMAPWWEPGARGSYHASSWGHLTGELVRRITGMTIGQFIAREIAGPLNADFYMGLSDDLNRRVATVYPADESSRKPKAAPPPDDEFAVERALAARTRITNFSGGNRDLLQWFNSPEWRRSEFPGSNGHTNAQGLVRIISALSLDGVSRGVKLLSPKTIAMIFREQTSGLDPYFWRQIRWGIGFALASDDNTKGPLPFIKPGKRTCFWFGRGGSLSLADVDRRIAIGYAQNQGQVGKNSLNGVYYNAVYDSL